MTSPHFPNLSSFPASDEIRAALTTILGQASLLMPEPLWLEAMQAIAESLHAEPHHIAPFVEAWRLLYVVTILLDHVQDGDALGDPQLESLPPALQYHLAFSIYIAAQHALTLLDSRALPPARIERLQRFWAESVARLASGQYGDLNLTWKVASVHQASALDRYEWLAREKTGVTFALAFGGAAMLTTDDTAVIAALIEAGSAYGMLLQYYDDLKDRDHQEGQSDALTLPRALLAAHPGLAGDSNQAAAAFWRSIYAAYRQAVGAMLAPLPATTRTRFEHMLTQSFGEPA